MEVRFGGGPDRGKTRLRRALDALCFLTRRPARALRFSEVLKRRRVPSPNGLIEPTRLAQPRSRGGAGDNPWLAPARTVSLPQDLDQGGRLG